MAKGIVYKQWYRSRNRRQTPTLNKKHLIYIATRPGAIYNPGCGFCLWGKIPGMVEASNIDNLETVKKLVVQDSRSHTLYRAVFSLNHEDALAKGYYDRDAWQKLVTAKADTIAKEMDIDRQSMVWVAAYHHVKGHPHIHVLYWDNSDKIRQEHIPEERFEIMSEHIRAAFNREIFRDEIRLLQKTGKEQLGAIRLDLQEELDIFSDIDMDQEQAELKEQLMALLSDMGRPEPLSLARVSLADKKEIGNLFESLIKALPQTGSLKYQYLDPEVKALVDDTTKRILSVRDFDTKLEAYLQTVEEISRQYGNGEKAVEHQRMAAMNEVQKQLGNELLHFIRANKLLELFADERSSYHKELSAKVLDALQSDPEINEAYHDIVDANIKVERDKLDKLIEMLQCTAGLSHDVGIRNALCQIIWDHRDGLHRHYKLGEDRLQQAIRSTLETHLQYKQVRALFFKLGKKAAEDSELNKQLDRLSQSLFKLGVTGLYPTRQILLDMLQREKNWYKEYYAAFREEIRSILHTHLEAHEYFEQLSVLFPAELTPREQYLTDEFKQLLTQTADLIQNALGNEDEKHREKTSYTHRRIEESLLRILAEDKGWFQAQKDYLVSNLLISVFRAFSSHTNHLQAKNRSKLRSLQGDISKQARRERAKEQANAGLDWEHPGM